MTQGITREDALALARASRGTGEQAPDPARARALALARAAREYPEPGFGDYLAEFGASAVESVAGPLRGFGSIADAMRRHIPGIDALDVQIGEGEESLFSTAGEAVGELAPETHPGAKYTFPGQVAGVAGGVTGFLAQAALIPGGALAKTLGAGVAMSASSFEQGQQRALAEGASQDDADIAALKTSLAGAIQALPIGRGAARIFGKLANAVSKSILGGAAANAAEFVGVNAVGKGWSEYVAQEIRDEAEAKEVWDAAFSGTLPEVVVGFMLGGAATWRANKRGARLSEQALAEVEAAGVEVARNLAARRDAAGDAADGAADGGDEFVARPPPGSDPDRSGDGDPDAPDALGPIELGPDGPDGAGGAQMTRIEAPDDATAAVVERFSRSIKWKTPLEIHEAPVRLRERAARVGMKLVGVKGEEPLPGEGYYDRETGTAIIDLGGEGGPKRMEDVLRHEINHHAEKTRPELAKAWADALDEIAPGWTEHAAKARSKAQKLAKLPGLSKEGAEEEGRSEAAEGLGTILDVLDAQPDLVAQVAAHKPGMLRTLADFLIDFANKIRGSKDKSISAKVRELQAVLELHGSDIEKSVGAEGASRLALKLRDLHAALAVEESVEQPRANKKANEFLAPIESAEVQGPQPKATKRAGLRAGMPAHDIVGALSDISRRIEDALLAGESLDAPRLRELRKDRTTAEGLLYEADPTHAALSREDPVAIWKRIVAEDETATTERRKQAEKRGVAIGRAHEAFEADVKRNTDKRQREKMGQEVAYERAFQKMLAEEEQAATKRADDERADDAKARKGELKALREDIRSRVKPEPKAKKATKAKAQAAADTKRQDVLAAHYARIAERKAEEAANPREPEPVAPEPEKKKLPVRWKREKLDDPRLKDEVVRDELGAMIHGAKWMIVGGTKDMPGRNRDSDKHYIRHKWTAEQDWVRMRANAGFKFNLEETKRIIKDALADRVLTANERLYATWLIDTAHESAFRGADTPEDMARAREFYLDEKIRRGERPIGENESLPDAGAQEDVPFALPIKTREAAAHQAELEGPQERLGRLGRLGRQGRLERFLEPIRAGAERNAVRRLIWAEGNTDQAFPVSVEGAKTNLVLYLRPFRPPGRLSERMVRLRSLARLFIEQELNLDTETKQREWDSLEAFEFQPSARRGAYEAELRERNGWMETFQGALRDGETDAAAARLAAAAHPEALNPSRFLAGFDDPAFALPGGKGRDGSGLREFLARYEGGDPHYAVTSKGKLTIAAREASEQFWEKETISKTQTARGAREMLATKAGKTEVDAAIRGQHPGDWREQSTLTVAAEMRVNNLLRAAAQGTTNARAAIGLAVDYFMLRSEQGRALSAVQRPRTPRESFWQEMSEPTPDNAKALKKLQNQLRVTSTPEAKAKIRERIEEIKADEARLFDKGMLALRKAGIDPETMADTPAQAAHAFRVANIAKGKGFWDWMLELRASGLVSSPATTVSALGGNVLNVGWNTVLARIAELPVPGGATAGEIRAITAALPGAWNKGLRAFWNVVTTDAPTYEAQLKQLGLIDQAQNFENAKLASIPGIPGRLVRGIGLTPMTAVDEFARAMGSELEAVAIAHRRSGGDPAQMRRLLGSTEVWSEAVKNTRRNIFQETDENALVTTGFKVREALDHLGGNTVPVGHLIFPFVRTGVNGVLEALRKLPGPAQIVAGKHIIKGEWKGDPELRARDVSAQILSVVVGTTIWQLANMEDEKGRPYITGSQPGTRAQKSDAWKTAPPMSYRVGDQWRSYRKWMPFALMTAAVLDAAQDGVDPMSVVLSLGAQAVDATYLSTLSSLLDAVQSEAPTSDKIAQVGDDFARSFIPNLVRSGLAAKKDEVTIDPLRAKGGKELGWTDRARAYTGTLESEQQYDNWGRPMEKGGNVMERWLSPSPPNRRIAWHAADQTIAAWNDDLPDGESPWVPSKAQYWYTVRGVTKYMSPKQSSAFQRRAGELAAGMLDESTLDPKNPTRAQIDRIKKALSRARSRARREVLNEIPDEEEEDG